MLRNRYFIAAATLFVTLSANAASNKVCMGGNVEQLSSTQALACKVAAQQVKAAADKAGASDWHFVVVCDEAGWQDYAAFSNIPAAELNLATTDTNLEQRTTFVRATRLTADATDRLATQVATASHRDPSTLEIASVR